MGKKHDQDIPSSEKSLTNISRILKWLRHSCGDIFKYRVSTAYKDKIKNISTSLNIFLPCSTTLEENSSLRVSWEQLEPDDEGRGSGLGAWSEPDLAPPVGSIPTKGRKPTRSPKSMDAHTGSRCILSCEVAQTISLTKPFETLAAGVLFQMKN